MLIFPRAGYPGNARIPLNDLQISKRDDINSKLISGEYEFESINCLVCGSASDVVITERDCYALSYSVKICSNCGFVYTSPRLNSRSYGLFYENEYRELYEGTNMASEDFFEGQRRKGLRLYKYLKSKGFITIPSMKVLEVGCGAGGILDVFKKNGHKVIGIDLGSDYINYGKSKYGLDLRVSYLEDLNLDYKPDLVIYSHVMEHISDPIKEMKVLATICGPNTLVYIEVPGLFYIHKSYNMDMMLYFQNAHTFHFTLNSLNYLMTSCGFKGLSGNEYIKAVYCLGKSEARQLDEYSNILRYMQRNEHFRVWYRYTFGVIKRILFYVNQLISR